VEKLFLRFLANDTYHKIDGNTTVQWILHTDDQELDNCGKITLEHANSLVQGRQVIVLLPIEDVFVTQLAIHAKNKKQLKKAIPFALEDELADDIEELHFATGSKTADGKHPVAVISKAKLEYLIDTLAELKIVPHLITIDIFGIHIEDNHWTLCIDQKHVIARVDKYNGFGCELRDLNDFIQIMTEAQGQKPEMINVYCHPDEDIKELQKEPNVFVHDFWKPTNFVIGFDVEQSINFLQGPYAKSDKQSITLRPWKIAAVLATIWIGLLMTQIGIENWQLNKIDSQLKAEIDRVFLQTFPQASTTQNARKRMEQEVKRLTSSDTSDQSTTDFLKLLYHISYELNKEDNVSIVDIRYRGNQLALEIHTKDVQILEKAKTNLQAKDIQAELKSAKSEDNFIRAQLLVSE
jgi:general secretion pathway protein L